MTRPDDFPGVSSKQNKQLHLLHEQIKDVLYQITLGKLLYAELHRLRARYMKVLRAVYL